MAVRSRPAVGEGPAAAAAASVSPNLSGQALSLAHAALSVSIAVTLVLFVAALPARSAQLAETMASLSPSQVLVLEELGVSPEGQARLVLGVEIGVALCFFAVGLIIFWRRPTDWVAMWNSAGQIMYIAWISPPLDALQASDSFLYWPALLVQILAMTNVIVFLYVFPNGRLVPRWSWLFLALWAVWAVLWALLPGSLFDLSDLFTISLPSFILTMAWLASGLLAQLYRFQRMANPVERQQAKFVLASCAVAISGYLVFGFDRFAVPVLDEPRHAGVVYDLVGVPLTLLISLVLPFGIGFSMLRYRLWDIDLLLNRALVYGMLTAILSGLYTASITFSQRLFVALTGERSDAAIVFTTLVVASTFTSLKGRLQVVVDRYVKEKPDPTRHVRAFSEQLRSVVDVMDVERVTARALDEMVRAFGATSGAVYMLRDGHFVPVYSNGDWAQIEGMSVWLEHEGVRFGWITLGPREDGLGYSEEDLGVFSEVAELVSGAIWIAMRARLAEDV
ncbi:MAG: hypothetical protein ACYC4L_16170 [Chloroflexota bacterium]